MNVSSLGGIIGDEVDAKKVQEKIERYKKSNENYKQNNELLTQQLSLLKAEIKNYKKKLEEVMSYEGRINEYEEFKSLVGKVLDSFKPKKKEQEEIVKKIKDHINLSNVLPGGKDPDNVSVTSEKKKGFFGGLFNKDKDKEIIKDEKKDKKK
jgi:hypothetical protein